MKNSITVRGILIAISIALPSVIFGQGNTFKLDGNNNLDNNKFIGSTNAEDLIFKTNSIERLRLKANGDIISTYYFHILDSMRVSGPLFIGDSTLVLQDNVSWNSIPSDHISSSKGKIALGNYSSLLPLQQSTFSNIKVGIGIHDPKLQLQIHSYQMIGNVLPKPSTMSFTNSGGSTGGTGDLASDGFLLGISSNGNAALNQQENKDMIFYTGNNNPNNPPILNLERMRITKDGSVEINMPLVLPMTKRLNVYTATDDICGYFRSIYSNTNPLAPISVITADYAMTGFTGPTHGICSLMDIGNTTSDVYGLHTHIISTCSDGLANANYGLFSEVKPNTQKINYGVYSQAVNAQLSNIAGYFNAPLCTLPNCTTAERHAIVTEKGGGNVCINCDTPALSASISPYYDLYVNGKAFKTLPGIWETSDSIIKTNISNYIDGLNVIKNITPIYYNYNGLAGINSDKQYIGVLAQKLAPIAPYMVDTMNIILHPLDTYTTQILTMNPDAFFYMSINAIKQLDSITSGMPAGATNGCYVNTNKQVELGTNPLNHNTTIPLNNNNLGFGDPTNPTIGTNIVKIGDLTSKSIGKFNVNNTTETVTGLFQSKINSTTANQNIAVMGDMYGIASAANYAGYFNTGLTGNKNFGVFAQADGGSANYGIYASVHGNYPNNVAGYFNGDVYSTGSYLGSDAILKDNVLPLTNAINIINQLQPKTFTFKTSQYPQMSLPTGSQFGLIAQDVETLLPNLVKEATQPEVIDTAGNIVTPAVTFKSLKYEAFIPILIQGAKEQQSTIDSLKQQIQDLQNQMAQVLNNNNGGAKIINNPTTQTDVNLSNRKIVLDQNAPNPFKDQTTITYEIKSDFKTATIIFVDNLGDVIKEVPITQKGKGQLNVYASDLTSGIYTYTIVVDGNTIDTKKMVKMK